LPPTAVHKPQNIKVCGRKPNAGVLALLTREDVGAVADSSFFNLIPVGLR
jgi:hypothetical protein